jgi:hypothetical protein
MEDLIYDCVTMQPARFHVQGHVSRRRIVGEALGNHDLRYEFDVMPQDIFRWAYGKGWLVWRSEADGEWCESDMVAYFVDAPEEGAEPVTWLVMEP